MLYFSISQNSYLYHQVSLLWPFAPLSQCDSYMGLTWIFYTMNVKKYSQKVVPTKHYMHNYWGHLHVGISQVKILSNISDGGVSKLTGFDTYFLPISLGVTMSTFFHNYGLEESQKKWCWCGRSSWHNIISNIDISLLPLHFLAIMLTYALICRVRRKRPIRLLTPSKDKKINMRKLKSKNLRCCYNHFFVS